MRSLKWPLLLSYMVFVSSSLVKVRGRKLKPISIILFLSFVLLLFTPSFNSEEPKDTGWDNVPISTNVDLNDVISWSNGILNGTSAIAVGDGGKMYHTENSGTNWSEIDSGVVPDLNAIEFNDYAVTGDITVKYIYIDVCMGINYTTS